MLNAEITGHETGQETAFRVDDRPQTGACAALCKVLREGSDVQRTYAARALGRIGDTNATGALINALLDEDEDVRSEAAEALACLRDRAANHQLLENLIGDPCLQVKLNAIDALTATGEEKVIPWLLRLATSRDPEVAWDEEDFHQGGWDDWVDVQVKSIESLGRLGAVAAVPEILSAINDEENQDVTDVAFAALAKLGAKGIDALASFLDDPKSRRRRGAAAILAGLPGKAALHAVSKALTDPEADVRLAAITVLAERDPGNAHVRMALTDRDPKVRAAVLRIAGVHHADLLVSLLEESSQLVQQAALEVIAQNPELPGDVQVAETVRNALKIGDPETAACAARALAALLREDAIEDLAIALEDEARAEVLRLGAIEGLTLIGGADAVAIISRTLGGRSEALRVAAMAALGRFSQGERWPNPASQILIEAQRGSLIEAPREEPETENTTAPKEQAPDESAGAQTPGEVEAGVGEHRKFPVSTLGAILGPDTPASELMKERSESEGLTPADLDYIALAEERKIRKRVISSRSKVAPHKDVRRVAARILGDCPHLEAFNALCEALGDTDEDIARIAADSLSRIAPEISKNTEISAEPLIEALATPDREKKLNLIRALGLLGDREVAKSLKNGLRDDNLFIRTETVRAIGNLRVHVPGFMAKLNDRDASVRKAAATALLSIEGEDAFDTLFEWAFALDGYHRRDAARLLSQINADMAAERFISILDDPGKKKVWRVSIEALEELSTAGGVAGV